MIKFLAFLGWLIIFGAIYTKDFNPHSFYNNLFKPATQVEEVESNPPDMKDRQIFLHEETGEEIIIEEVQP